MSSTAQIPISPAPSEPVSCPLEKAVEKFAVGAKIAHRGVEILNWCQFMGAVDLAELGGCVDQFCSDLNLKPFEIARARKYLEGLGQSTLPKNINFLRHAFDFLFFWRHRQFV